MSYSAVAQSARDPNLAPRVIVATDRLHELALLRQVVARRGHLVDAVSTYPQLRAAMSQPAASLVLGGSLIEAWREQEATADGVAWPAKVIAIFSPRHAGRAERLHNVDTHIIISSQSWLADLFEALDPGGADSGTADGMTDEAASSTAAAVDLSELRRRFDDIGLDEDGIIDLVAAFLGDTPGGVGRLVHAAEAGDPAMIASAAHALKSPAATFGADRLAALAADMETAARAGSLDDAPSVAAQIQEEYERVEALLLNEYPQLRR